jgi:hypothetical protein
VSKHPVTGKAKSLFGVIAHYCNSLSRDTTFKEK